MWTRVKGRRTHTHTHTHTLVVVCRYWPACVRRLDRPRTSEGLMCRCMCLPVITSQRCRRKSKSGPEAVIAKTPPGLRWLLAVAACVPVPYYVGMYRYMCMYRVAEPGKVSRAQ